MGAMDSVAFIVPGQPVPQGAIRYVPVRGRLRGVHASGKRLKRWRDAVSWEAVRARGERPIPFPKPKPVSLFAAFRMRRPQRPKAPWPIVTPDLQHLVRAIEDAMSGILYDDDSQIVRLEARKEYVTAEQVSGVTIVVRGFSQAQDRAGATIAPE